MPTWTAETADWYAATYGEYATNTLAVAALAPLLSPGATVVDVGCGTGCALRAAAQHVTRGALIGVDLVPRMVEHAEARAAAHPAAARLAFHAAPAHALPLEADTADVVFAFDAYDHWAPAQAAALAEVRRVLRPGGVLAVVKDGGIPGADQDAFEHAMRTARFDCASRVPLEGDGATGLLTLWHTEEAP